MGLCGYQRTLLKPRACRYHSLTELSVDFRERSNMKRMATASLQTRGSMLTNSRWPPRSHIENVMVVLRTDIVFSMKLTPASPCNSVICIEGECGPTGARQPGVGVRACVVRTQRLDIILVEAALDVLDHETGLSDLRIPNHSHLDDDAVVSSGVSEWVRWLVGW